MWRSLLAMTNSWWLLAAISAPGLRPVNRASYALMNSPSTRTMHENGE
jgi:hypothetical protein